MKERRRHERRPVSIPIEYVARGNLHTGVAINKSEGGMYIRGGEDVSVGEEIVVIYPFAMQGKKTRHGSAARMDNDGFGVAWVEYG
ncbi:MAG: PilZ domain-containing protein [Deltaproteobacteria bacterium]|nr:PilZ domain-containing protein [Deltaproteobacteria bacterium]